MKKIVLSSLFLMAFVLGFSQIGVAQSVKKSSDTKKEVKKADPQAKKAKPATIKNDDAKKQVKKTKPVSPAAEAAPTSSFSSSKQQQPVNPVAPQPKKEKENTEKKKETPRK